MSATGSEEQAFKEAILRFDEANSADPNTVAVDGKAVPYELFYALRLTEWVERLSPNASPALLLAARCQHICRWMIPRSSHPMTRAGYLKWRTDLKQFHAQKSGELLTESGCSPELVSRIQELNLKKNLGHDDELQILEDALCLVTLQYQLTDLVRKTEPEKMISILQKTWKKMSAQGRDEALRLSYPDDQKSLLSQALAGVES
jgi:inorganic triphosphatase YgiF